MPVLNGSFNVTDASVWGSTGVLIPDGSTDNSANLNNMIQSLLDPGGITLGQGGTLEFPSAGNPSGGSSYAFGDTINIGPVGSATYPSNVILRGTGAQDRSSPLLEMLDSTKDFFVIANHGGGTDDNITGIVFQDMIISYKNATGSGSGNGITAQHGSVRLQRVLLDEVPGVGVWFQNGSHSSIIDSFIRVEAVSSATAIRVGDNTAKNSGIEIFIAGTTLGAYNTSGTGIVVYGAEHLRMVNCRLEGWTNSIIIEPHNGTENSRKLYFGNVSCFSSEAALQIIPANNAYATELWFAQCEFGPGNQLTDYAGAGLSSDQRPERTSS